MTRCAKGDPTRGTPCVVAARNPLRYSPVLRATNYGFDAVRMCEQLQRYFSLRGADAITDHGAENVDIAKRTSTETFFAALSTRHSGIAVVVFKHRTLLGGVGIELASYRF